MHITINLPQDLETDLLHQANQANISLQTLILETLRKTTPSARKQWSASVLNYQATPDFPAFESYRNELKPPQDPILF